jgi:hypothetical protein
MPMGVGGGNTSQPRSNHNDIDSPVYYVQLGRLSLTADVSHYNINWLRAIVT